MKTNENGMVMIGYEIVHNLSKSKLPGLVFWVYVWRAIVLIRQY